MAKRGSRKAPPSIPSSRLGLERPRLGMGFHHSPCLNVVAHLHKTGHVWTSKAKRDLPQALKTKRNPKLHLLLKLIAVTFGQGNTKRDPSLKAQSFPPYQYKATFGPSFMTWPKRGSPSPSVETHAYAWIVTPQPQKQAEPTPRRDPESLGMAQTSSNTSRIHAWYGSPRLGVEATESAQHQSKSTLPRLGVESQLSWADLSFHL
ncbi:hypothetical protein PIB30_080250 [Stylosanthes scabra]|uniref:Uncharacterized protein n=1 Tax=Stylosanthes scabra TaxID=79078 RepID=A0ABU6QR28_9FABA|nr:hypothetical protein [Stylosanthes scabra]